MISSEEFGADQEKFAFHANDYWEKINGANSKQANAATRAGNNIVNKWSSRGRIVDFLTPLLFHPSPRVRFGASSHLINSEARESAISVLRELVIEDFGLVGVTAQLILEKNDIKK